MYGGVSTDQLRATGPEWNIFLACDLRLVSPRFMERLVRRVRVTCSDALAPRPEDGWQPPSAAYYARCRTAIMPGIHEGRRSIIGLFDEIQKGVGH